MTTEEKMTVDERRKYLRKMKKRYVRASRKEQGRLLDEMKAVTDMHRKSLTRLMNSSLERKPRCRQRGAIYGPEVDDALRVISESLDYICAERLTPNLVWMAEHLAAHDEMVVRPPLLEQLGQVSVSTVRRRLSRMKQDQPHLPRRGAPRSRKLTRDIPMQRIPWDEQEPGHFEVDLVYHCGANPSGEFVYTLQMIDVATGWSERRAILGRSYLVMEDAFRRILAHLPFAVREIHSDNGSEFLNYHLIRFWKEIVKGVQLSRSRPYQKNDNRFVEQKNATLVRAYLGYDRLDTVAQARAVNWLYDKMGGYYNFFQPVMRLQEKVVVSAAEGQATRLKRHYDLARTPFDRLCTTEAIPQECRTPLQMWRNQTNPRQLRQEIYALIDYIFSLPGAAPGQTEDVHQLLATNASSEMRALQFDLTQL
jgi:transposase InsO family protein